MLIFIFDCRQNQEYAWLPVANHQQNSEYLANNHSRVPQGINAIANNFWLLQVNLANDHRYMPQIVSSAIVNAPPPEGVIKTLHVCSTAHKNIDKSTKVIKHAQDVKAVCTQVHQGQQACRTLRNVWTQVHQVGRICKAIKTVH